MLEKLSSVLFRPTSENSTFMAPMVWRTPCEEFDPKYRVPTVKHGGGSVMVCGYFTRRGDWKINRIMDRFYLRDIFFSHQSTILNWGNNPTSCMIMIVNISLG